MKKLFILIFFCLPLIVSAQTYTLNYDSIRVGKTPNSSILIPNKLFLKGLPKGNLSVKDNGQVIHNDTVYAPIGSLSNYKPTTPPLGTIYNNSNFTSLTDFVNNGATASVSSGHLLINGVGPDYTHSLDYNYNSMLPNWTMTARLIVPTVTSTSVMAIGLRSTNVTNPHSVAVALDLSNRGTAGRLLFLYGTTLSTSIISTSNLAFVAGDTLDVVISRNDFIHWTARVTNKTTPNATDVSAVYNNETATTGLSQAENTGRFSIFANCVDVITYLSLKMTSATPKHADFAMVSDSKLGGAGATTYMQSVIGSLSYYNNIAHLSGGGDGTDAVISRLPEIIALAPKVVFLDIGRNDLALYGLSLSTVMANIATIYNTLTAAGIQVWVFNGEWETTYPTGTLAAAITAAYPNNSIDTYTPTKAGGASVLAPDGIHLSDIGQDLLSNFLRTQNKANVKTYTVGTNSSIYNPNIYGTLQTYGGLMNLSHPTANVIAFRNVGAAIPSFTTRSLGTKLSFYANTLGGSSGEYAMGIATSTLWTSVPSSTQKFEWYGGVSVVGTLTGTGNFSVPGTIASGTAGASLGSYLLSGNTSGTISIKPQAAAGTYNFNLPTTAGTSGQVLASGGGVAAPMTWVTPFANPMTTAGDIIHGGASGVSTRLAAGSATQVLHSGTTPSWSAVSLSADVSGTLPATNGGTGQNTYTTGDFNYASATNTLSKRAIGSTGDLLTVVGGVPTWQASTYLKIDGSNSGGTTLNIGSSNFTANGTVTLGSAVPGSTKDVAVLNKLTVGSVISISGSAATVYSDATNIGTASVSGAAGTGIQVNATGKYITEGYSDALTTPTGIYGYTVTAEGYKLGRVSAANLNTFLGTSSTYVPYTGATATLNLGSQALTTNGSINALNGNFGGNVTTVGGVYVGNSTSVDRSLYVQTDYTTGPIYKWRLNASVSDELRGYYGTYPGTQIFAFTNTGLALNKMTAGALATDSLVAHDSSTGKLKLVAPAAGAPSYSEGSWTPLPPVGVTFLAGFTGHYTKVGNLVTLSFEVTVSGISGTPSNSFYIGNLPFTNSTLSYGAGFIAYQDIQANAPTALINKNTASIYFYNQSTSLTETDFFGKTVRGTIVYSTTN